MKLKRCLEERSIKKIVELKSGKTAKFGPKWVIETDLELKKIWKFTGDFHFATFHAKFHAAPSPFIITVYIIASFGH